MPPGRVRLGFAVALVAVVVAGCGSPDHGTSAAEAAAPRIEVQRLEAFRPAVFTEVRSGDTLESVSRRLAGPEWVVWRDALTAELDPRRLRPGTEFAGECSPSGRLETLRVTLDQRSELELELGAEGIRARRVEHPVERVVVRLAGEVESSLFGAIAAAGGRPELAVRVAEVFQWDIDFLRDLRQGDRFVAVVEEESVEGEFYRYGAMYAVRFVNQGRVLDAVAFPDEDGRVGYYDPEGRPLRKQFLRSPLKFSRVTSRFSLRRYHPVYKRVMPHYGVDYGAPVGTPAHVTSSGTVAFAGRKRGAGNMVTVRHPNGFETSYLHLSSFGRGVRAGARVAQGQVIGYVGSSGASTGPHLDYRVKQNGRWINPLALASPPAKPLEPERLAVFSDHAEVALALLGGQVPAGDSLWCAALRAQLESAG